MRRRDFLKGVGVVLLGITTIPVTNALRQPHERAATAPELHLWCDGFNGNDLLDGLTPKTAVKSIQEALDRLPQCLSKTTVHLSNFWQ